MRFYYDGFLQQRSHQSDRLSSIGDIISYRRLGLSLDIVARLDSGVPARDALNSSVPIARRDTPSEGLEGPPGPPRQTLLHQIGDG